MLKLSIKLTNLMHLLVILSVFPAGSVTDTQCPMEAASYRAFVGQALVS